jgi:tetratricopeptide (TPR) repeat protein
MTHTLLHLDEVERVPAGGAAWWRPIRRCLGVSAFGVNAYTAEEAGDPLIETHDETSPGSGRHEELYVVLFGRATFTVDGGEVDAPAGSLLFVAPGTERGAVAAAASTTVLVIGGTPGAALPVSPYEHWYAAAPAYQQGDYARAVQIASEGLGDWPEHPHLRYQLACYEALAGHHERAVEHLRIAYAGNPRTREWASEDPDLESVRNHPALRG